MSKDELHEELTQRGIDYDCVNKKDLEKLLIKEMEGIQRVPSLIFSCPSTDLDDIFLENYEIIGCEPLHDIMNEIKNLLNEIPHHVMNNKDLEDLIKDVFCWERNEKRC